MQHRAPIPLGCRVGGLLYSSAVLGVDPATGEMPGEGPAQARIVFDNVRRLLAVGDATTDDVVFMHVLIADDDLRDVVNECWIAMFPDPADRPARHTTCGDLPGGMRVQVELVAVVEDGAG